MTDLLALPTLQTQIIGRVITPGDPDFDVARAVALGDLDRRPALIVQVADAGDIARVIALARATGLPLAVRSGGHSGAGHGVIDGGIIIDLRAMHAIEIDVEGRTAWAESGLTAGEYTTAVAAHGLATGFGDTASVGLGGITLGGGIGYLVRAYGLTIDSLLAAEIVTADGTLLHVDEVSHPELFWAIRGGGGNLGVVTRFRYRLHDVGQVVGGMLILPATPDTLAGFIAAAEAAPESLSTIANVMNCPPLPFVPEEHHGQVVILAMLCHVGQLEAGQSAVAPFRALATPIADLVKAMPYPEIYGPEDPDYHPTAVAHTMFLDQVDRTTARSILERLEASDASLRVAQLRVLGGAAARVPVDATAFAHRRSRILVSLAAFYEGRDDRVVRQAWVTDFAAALRQGDDGAYVNFLADEGEARVRAAYPGQTWERLRAVKATYDPTNLFRSNQNIPPAVVGDGDGAR
jgi:hypothetical protein